VLLDRLIQVGGGDGERGVQAVHPCEPGAGVLGGRVVGQGVGHGGGARKTASCCTGHV
jgi:hypothetical protein